MAITQNTFETQPGGLYPGQSGDTSPQINAAKTVAEGAEFTYGDAAFSVEGIHLTNAIDEASLPLFEGVVARFFRKGNATLANDAPGKQTGTKFTNPDTVTTSIFGLWAVVASEAITKPGQVALNPEGKFVEAKPDVYAVQGATYEGTCAAGEIIMVRLTGGKLLTKIEAPAA
ncbi:TPA: hypothetical protein JG819_004699 [Vibrio parahaemolyticus]|nr:hypothetical protein [Vibrio parahaemolyticus]HAV1545599.1 hypothetical protein [Vibrio parahaemolyticus]